MGREGGGHSVLVLFMVVEKAETVLLSLESQEGGEEINDVRGPIEHRTHVQFPSAPHYSYSTMLHKDKTSTRSSLFRWKIKHTPAHTLQKTMF